MRLGGIARNHHVRRHIARDDRTPTNECVGADLHELMHGGETAKRHPVADLYVTAERGTVREHGVVANDAIVRHVRIRHEQVVVADAGHALIVRRAAIDGAVLAKDVPVADLEPRRLPLVLLVLGRIADRGELKEVVVRADASGTVDDDVRSHDRTRADLDIGPDDGERPHADIRRELRLRRYKGVRVDHLPVSGATIICAWATSTSPTWAAVAKRQIPLKLRSTLAESMS